MLCFFWRPCSRQLLRYARWPASLAGIYKCFLSLAHSPASICHTKCNELQTETRERHKHVVFKMAAPFAHVRVRKELTAHGVYGHFSFNLVGYKAYLGYCLLPSAKKLAVDVDAVPWSWPTVPIASLKAMCEANSPQMEARNGAVGGGRGRKRKLLTFSELTDAFVEGAVRNEREAWVLAKARKVGGDDTLYNTLGASHPVSALVARVRQAWHPEGISTGTLMTKPDFLLKDFVPIGRVGRKVLDWVRGAWKHQVLVLSGDGGLGKTELACALMHHVAPSKAFHFLNKADRIRDVVWAPGEGLVIDEVCLADMEIDNVKAWLDLKKTRDVSARNRDGTIPKGTPRIFATNWVWEQFWPRDAFHKNHAKPVSRRVLWVAVHADARRVTAAAPTLPLSLAADEADGFEEENPFGHEHGMDD